MNSASQAYKADASLITLSVIRALKGCCSFNQKFYYGNSWMILEAKARHTNFKFKLFISESQQRTRLRPKQFTRKLSFALKKGFHPYHSSLMLFLRDRPTSGVFKELKQLRGVIVVWGALAVKRAIQLLFNWLSRRLRRLRDSLEERGLNVRDMSLEASKLYVILMDLCRALGSHLGISAGDIT